MDFFEAQERARRHTVWLVVLFGLAVCGTVLGVYVAARVCMQYAWHRPIDQIGAQFWDPRLFCNVAGATLAVIVGGSLYKMHAVSASAESVALALGGRLVDPNTTEAYERRLLNVVEEMAIASGVPVPVVYLLPHEPGINAFALGLDPSRAAIAVTDGCLRLLSRDELQGVVAHEFSHLLNGDSRISLRLLGLVHGILVIGLLGSMLLRSGSRWTQATRRKASLPASLIAAGLCLYVIGWIGVFFARLIKAAVSRERELLADASGVQFTRDAAGLAGALKKVGGLSQGSLLLAPRAEEASHLYFGEGIDHFVSLMSTHPPLVKRIRQLDPQFRGELPLANLEPVSLDGEAPGVAAAVSGGASVAVQPGAVIASIGALADQHVAYAQALVERIPQRLREGVREPWAARAAVLGLLVADDPGARAVQMEALLGLGNAQLADQVSRASAALRNCPREARLPILDLAMPALRRLSPAQFGELRDAVDRLVHADSRVGLFEYTLQRVLMRHLSVHFELEPGREGVPLEAGDAVSLLLSMLAWAGSADPAVAAASFQAARAELSRGRFRPVFLPHERCDVRELDRALRRLADTAPRLRAEVLAACVAAVASDGRVTIAEGELLRAISDSLGCPMPPLLPGQRAAERPAAQPPLRRAGS